MFHHYTDEMLIGPIQNSEHDAFNELYRRYWIKLYSSARRRISSTEDAKDIVQELFVKLWARRSRLASEINVSQYLFSALRYRIINYIEAGTVRIKYVNEQLADHNRSNRSSTTGLHSALEELKTVVGEVVATMPKRMQQIFMLSYGSGAAPKEIATQLSLSVQTVKNNLSNARAMLREKIASQSSGVSKGTKIVI